MSTNKFKAAEWQRVEAGELLDFEIKPRTHLVIRHAITANGEIAVYGTDPEDPSNAIPLQILRGNGTARLALMGFSTISAEVTAPAGIAVSLNGGEHFEEWDREPPPEKAEPTNVLARMRAAFRSQIGITRETFLEGGGLPGYELPDDAGDIFEEEEAALRRSIKAKETEKDAPTEVAGPDGPSDRPVETDVGGNPAGNRNPERVSGVE